MNNKISIVFFGTHNFAAQILQGMIDSDIFDIQLVITQPDQPVGRKQILTPPPVKLLAEKYKLKIAQPVTLKNYELGIRNYDIGVCAQYGLIIPENILNIPKFGTLNIHTSLLPKFRGASPIQAAIMNGETETGVTIMKMDVGMDTGSILVQESLKIEPDDNYNTLGDKLAKIANLALTEAVPNYIAGKIVPQPQDEAKSTYTKILTREDGKIDWSKSAQEIYNQFRGLTPWPGIWTTTDEVMPMLGETKRIKLLNIKPTKIKTEDLRFKIHSQELFVACSDFYIEVIEMQIEGSKVMSAKDFINGFKHLFK